jgi:Ca2+-transporting ATPase
MPERAYYKMAVEEVVRDLDTTEDGLSESEAGRRLSQYGKNVLKAKIKMPLWLLFLSQFRELLVIILIVGGIISFMIGSYRDGTIIFLIVLVNAVIGFIHEHRAGKIIDKLESLIKSPAKVIRDGELREISQENLVPGDILKVEEGDKLPADIRLIEAAAFKTNDFALTGESVPQEKHTDAIGQDVTIGDKVNMAFAGTSVATGNAIGVVTATGMETETGKIAGLTEEAVAMRTPLQEELRRLPTSSPSRLSSSPSHSSCWA